MTDDVVDETSPSAVVQGALPEDARLSEVVVVAGVVAEGLSLDVDGWGELLSAGLVDRSTEAVWVVVGGSSCRFRFDLVTRIEWLVGFEIMTDLGSRST